MSRNHALNALYLTIITITLLGSILFQLLNKAPQIWDSAAHINLSMLYAHKLEEGNLKEIMTLSGYYPPFVHITGGLFFLAIKAFNSPLILTFIYYVVGLIFLYSLSRKLFEENKNTALLVCTIFALLPQTYRELRLFELDLPLTILMITSLYFLHTSKGLAKLPQSLTFFLIMSLAQLTKWYAFIFAIVPFVYEIWRFRSEISKNLLKIMLNIGLGTAIVLVLTLPWYYSNYKTILNFFEVYSSKGETNDPKNLISLDNALEYTKLISVYQLYFINFLMSVGFVSLLLIKKKTKALYFLISIILPYLILTLLTNKDVRYVMPISIYFAFILAYGFQELQKSFKKASILALSLFLVINTLLYFLTSFNQFKATPKSLEFASILISGPVKKYNWFAWNPTEMSYQKDTWAVSKAFEIINSLNRDKSVTKVLFAVDYQYFNRLNFDTIQIYKVYGKQQYQVETAYEEKPLTMLRDYDFVVSSPKPGPDYLNHFQGMLGIYTNLNNSDNTIFEVKDSIKLPNCEIVYIYKNLTK